MGGFGGVFAGEVDEAVACDLAEPGGEFGGVAEGVEGFPCGEEGFLCEVFGAVEVSAGGVGEAGDEGLLPTGLSAVRRATTGSMIVPHAAGVGVDPRGPVDDAGDRGDRRLLQVGQVGDMVGGRGGRAVEIADDVVGLAARHRR